MIYFDNAATTCVFPEVVEAMQDAMQVTYGNPSAKHMKGIEAENKVKAAQELIAKTLRAKPKEILFTSWGNRIKQYSESLEQQWQIAAKGSTLLRQRQNMLLYMNQCIIWKKKDNEVTYLDVDSEGIVDLDQLEEVSEKIRSLYPA